MELIFNNCKRVYYKILIVASMIFCVSCSNNNDIPLYRIQENGLYGFIDSLGNVIIEPQYKYVSDFKQSGYATVITEYKYITKKTCLFDTLFCDTDTLLRIKFGFIDKNNKLVVDTTNILELNKGQINEMQLTYIADKASNYFNNNTLPFTDDIFIDSYIRLNSGLYICQDTVTKKMGYVNINGDTIIPCIYNSCRSFYNDIAIVSFPLYNKYDPTFNHYYEFIDSLFMNNVIMIDTLGNRISQNNYFHINNFSTNDYSWSYKINENDFSLNLQLLDKNGKISSVKYPANIYRAYNSNIEWFVLKENRMGIITRYSFINKDGESSSDFNNDGLIDIFNETFEQVTYVEENIAGFKVNYNDNPVWIFSDVYFKEHSQPFDSLFQFSDNLAAVKEFNTSKNSKWGFINKDYELVIPYKFNEVRSFNNGLAYFRIANVEGYINQKGEIIWKTKRY